MASIANTAERFKSNPSLRIDPEQVKKACSLAKFGWRERLLTPWVTVHLLMVQILQGNCSVRRMLRVAGVNVSQEAFRQARGRLPIDVLGYLATGVNAAARKTCDQAARWRGHRVLSIDGTGLSMPDSAELRDAYGLPGNATPGCSFPVMHALWLMDMATGLIRDFITSPCNTHDMKHACDLKGLLEPGDVVVGDRAFGTFRFVSDLFSQGFHAVCRAHQKTIIDFTPHRKSFHQMPKGKRSGRPRSEFVRKLGKWDQVVRYVKPDSRPKSMSVEQYDALPDFLLLREVRISVQGRNGQPTMIDLVTTLLDAKAYPKIELAKLFGLRWRIETDLLHLKQTLGMDVLRCESRDGIEKELWAYVMVYNLIRQSMAAAANRQDVAPDRISFIDAVDVMRHQPHLLEVLSLVVNPWRPGRHQPRVIKRRKDKYSYMTRPRDELKESLGITKDAA